jgi:hypothetical protein
MRSTPRKRRQVGRSSIALATPLFRYSASRDAYVLRGVGNRLGPVLTVKAPEPHTAEEHE